MTEQATPETPGTPENPYTPAVQPAEAPKKSGIVGKIVGVVVLIVVLAVAGIAYFALSDSPGLKAEVGKCLADVPTATGTTEAEANNASVVECTEADAKYKIIGKIDNKKKSEADAACQAAAPDYLYVYTEGKTDASVLVLCLTDK
ncbi:uncharacterized protein (UPF0333 family) [Allocatelliglobosispora scoriae]|uniref:Uncharacterized protein (UPF0333 family) n=1 Tax=Allocatelliglobosispora scoriae TaxID=643052 RepID=A0A841BT94_9ACTN|nr:hypothetical protein [Allocatelliglobosispora scoriae]MBB5870379.1 uncharacterized protein (UPF0333 family) [Allocatelliglobosispora scoriae]